MRNLTGETSVMVGERTARINLYGVIGVDVLSTDVSHELSQLSSEVKTLELHIGTPGGSVSDGIAIYHLIKNWPGEVRGYVDGIAASMGSVIAMACDTLVMNTGSVFMIHEVQNSSQRPSQETYAGSSHCRKTIRTTVRHL